MKLMVRTDEEARIDWAVVSDSQVLVSGTAGDRAYYDQFIQLSGSAGVSSLFTASERIARCYEEAPDNTVCS